MKNSKKLSILTFLIISAITAVYVSLIFNQNIWTDEAYTIELVESNTVSGIISGTANDVHPPLYYIITKFFISVFGTSIQVYKIISIIPLFLTMLLSLFYIKPWFGNKASILFLLFLNAIPCVMEYGVQIRMYSWALFFITLAGLSAYGVFISTGQKQLWLHLIILTSASLCACYTHNFAMISSVFIYILLGMALIFKSKKFPAKWLMSGIIVAIAYIPWLFVLLNQTTNRVDNYWIAPVTKDTVLGYFSDIFGSALPFTTPVFIIICIIALAVIFTSGKINKSEKLFTVFLFMIPLLTALSGILVSVLITPFFIARYIIPCMGLLALALSVALSHEHKFVYASLCAFLISMTAVSYSENYRLEYQSTNTEKLLDYMEKNMSENDVIVYNYESFGFIYACYFDKDKLYFLNDMDFSSSYDTIWYFDSCTSPWLSDTTLQENGLIKQYIDIFGIEHNDFLLYKIYR